MYKHVGQSMVVVKCGVNGVAHTCAYLSNNMLISGIVYRSGHTYLRIYIGRVLTIKTWSDTECRC